ncbi:UNVERIFIED_CONTAM: hypothetical protein RF648_18495 [Kocuria sp. CPCC 205274]
MALKTKKKTVTKKRKVTKPRKSQFTPAEKKERDKIRREFENINRNIRAIEAANMGQYSEAYQGWQKRGGLFFTIRGKTGRELQKEMARARNFKLAKTSTVSKISQSADKLAKQLKVDMSKKLSSEEKHAQLSAIFRLRDKITEYLQTEGANPSYNRIQTAVVRFQNDKKINLADYVDDLDNLVQIIGNTILGRADESDESDVDTDDDSNGRHMPKINSLKNGKR